MHPRKLQMIGGKTYAITLPKEWVKKTGMAPKNVMFIKEKDSETLILKTSQSIDAGNIDQIFLNTEEYKENLAQVFFASYYLGIDTIIIHCPKGFDTKTKNTLKKALSQMSGTEIIYEDKNKIKIKTLLNHTKLTLNQIFVRTSYIISELIDNLLNSDYDAIEDNENEIDRLYNLANKKILYSDKNYNAITKESIKTPAQSLAYFLIAKKLENIGDNLYSIGNTIKSDRNAITEIKKLVITIRDELKTKIKYLTSNKKASLLKSAALHSNILKDDVCKIKNPELRIYIDRILRAINDINMEIINLCFYEELSRKAII